jgi:hypothetical protein
MEFLSKAEEAALQDMAAAEQEFRDWVASLNGPVAYEMNPSSGLGPWNLAEDTRYML